MTENKLPIGFALWQAARTTTRAFEEYLFEGNGSLSTWLILLALQKDGHSGQGELATFVGVKGPTLTHHLNAMEEEGLIRRIRTKNDRRVHQVELTRAGQKLFAKLKSRAEMFDRTLTSAVTAKELATLRTSLGRVGEAAKRITRVAQHQAIE